MQKWCSFCRTQPVTACYLFHIWHSDETNWTKYLKLNATLSIRDKILIKAQTPHFPYISIPVLLIFLFNAFQLATTTPQRQLVFCHFDRETYKRDMGSLSHPPTFPIIGLLPSASFVIVFLVQFHTYPAFLVPSFLSFSDLLCKLDFTVILGNYICGEAPFQRHYFPGLYSV